MSWPHPLEGIGDPNMALAGGVNNVSAPGQMDTRDDNRDLTGIVNDQACAQSGLMQSCMPSPSALAEQRPCGAVEFKEISLLFEDAPPEGYIVNVDSLREMLRIARAANMQREFKIIQGPVFGHIPPYVQQPIAENAFPIFELKELSILFEDSAPEGYILNYEATREIVRIARASNLNKDFKIVHPTFFGMHPSFYQKPLRQNILTTSSVSPNFFPQGNCASSSSLNSNPSTSLSSFAAGSSRSIDSNISQGSLGPNRMQSRLMAMGNIDTQTARLLANLETQKRHIELRIRHTEEEALAKHYGHYKEVSQSDSELHKSSKLRGLVESFLVFKRRCYFSTQDLCSV